MMKPLFVTECGRGVTVGLLNDWPRKKGSASMTETLVLLIIAVVLLTAALLATPVNFD